MACLVFFIFVHELLALLLPAPNIVDIIEREEGKGRCEYGTGVPLIVNLHNIVLKFFEQEREVR